ncbi:MAG TPA: DUF4852 domain-containing protein [Alphaproteobacteria bacterium]
MTIPVQAADQKYTPVTLQTLSDALFKIGVLRYSDSLAVDEYIRIHHCGLYEQYGGDDIAWTRLREAQARELELMTPTFNDYVEIQGTIMLGAYDFASSRFEIDPESALKNTGIIDVVEYDGGSYEPCVGDQYKLFVPRAHPLHLTTRISNPLTLTSLPVNRQAGDQMVKIINSRVQNRVTRSALLVMRVHLLGPDPLSGSTEPSSLTVTGDLDEILVYDGPERNVLLYTEKFTKPEDKKKSDH